jgi:putative ABC transport system permease protein
MKKIRAVVVNFFAMLVVVLKRLGHNLGLSASTLVGSIAILALVVCVPVFSNAVSGEVLRQELMGKVTATHRGLFSIHVYYLDMADQAMTVENIDKVTEFINRRWSELLGFPIKTNEVEVQSSALSMVRVTGHWAGLEDASVNVKFLMLQDLPKYAKIIDGKWPEPDTANSGPIKVAINQSLADTSLLNVGDRIKYENFEVEIAGIWAPLDSANQYWFSPPEDSYADKIWVPRETYASRVNSLLQHPAFYSSWYVIGDDSGVKFEQSPQYARGLIRLDGELKRLLPGITNDYSPLEALQAYETRAASLMTTFYAVGAPMIVLALLFISLTARIATQQYEQEVLTMRGRGTSWQQVVIMNLAESLLLLLISLPIALLAGWLAARVMGDTVSFLKFTDRSTLVIPMQGVNVTWLAGAAFLILFARFLPVLGLSRSTIVKLKQEQSRGGQKPLWERFYLDFLLLLPGIYAYVTMSGWAKPAQFLAKLQETTQQYRDPLLFVAPALFAMALCMILLRVVPLVVRLLALLVERLPNVWAYLSLQQIARRPQDHSSALLLIMISLSLSIYSASMAKTLDRWLYDSAYYQAGSDLAIHEYVMEGGGQSFGPGGPQTSSATLAELDVNSSFYVNIEDHLQLPSVVAATRVGRYAASFSYGVGEQECQLIGIDRLDFPGTAYFRDDFASDSLGALMNALAMEPMGVLLPKDQAQKLGLRKGDQLIVASSVADVRYERNMVVVGTYDYFPTVYPSETPTLIANLSSIFDNPESVSAYDVWLRLKPNADVNVVIYQVRLMIAGGRSVVKVNGDAMTQIRKGQDQPERMGMFGVLNVGFIATGLMPGIGFVLYSYASLRRRFIQLGILQALGLSVRQLIGYLVSEQFLLMGLAISLGALVGLVTSNLFVPFLQISSSPGKPVPPFQVLIGWTESAWLSMAFGVVLFLTIIGTIVYLARLKVFQAVKMGETL